VQWNGYFPVLLICLSMDFCSPPKVINGRAFFSFFFFQEAGARIFDPLPLALNSPPPPPGPFELLFFCSVHEMPPSYRKSMLAAFSFFFVFLVGVFFLLPLQIWITDVLPRFECFQLPPFGRRTPPILQQSFFSRLLEVFLAHRPTFFWTANSPP